jgi:DNA-directed RNA polymerase specialized sigma24 family protein
MSKIAKRALISSLLASAVAAPVAAKRRCDHPVDELPCRTVEATRPCGHPVSWAAGPQALSSAVLLADGVLRERAAAYLRDAHRASPEEAEDAAQEAAMRALQRGIRSCCAATFRSWLQRTAQNAWFDMRKKARRSAALPAEPEQLNAAVGPSAETGPGELLAVRDDVERLLADHDLTAMTPNKQAMLGTAIADHLTGGQRLRGRRVTRPLQLLAELAPALAGLATTD